MRKRIIYRKRDSKTTRIVLFSFFIGFICVVIAGSYLLVTRFGQNKPYISPLAAVLSKTTHISIKEKTEQEIKFYLASYHIQYESLMVMEDSIRIRLLNGQEVLFATGKSLKTQTSSLQLILSRLTIEGKRFSKIDFRFDRPVIVYE